MATYAAFSKAAWLTAQAGNAKKLGQGVNYHHPCLSLFLAGAHREVSTPIPAWGLREAAVGKDGEAQAGM